MYSSCISHSFSSFNQGSPTSEVENNYSKSVAWENLGGGENPPKIKVMHGVEGLDLRRSLVNFGF